MRGQWLNRENNQSEQAIVGRAWWIGMMSAPADPQMMYGVNAKYLKWAVLCLAVVALLLMEGCSGIVNMDPSERDQLRNEPEIRALHAVAPSPLVFTAGSGMTGVLLGGIGGPLYELSKAESLGKELAEEHGLEDSALELQNHFVARVSADLGLKDIEPVPAAVTTETARTVSLIQDTYRTGLMFVFETTANQYSAQVFSPSRLWLGYGGKGSLYRLEDSQKLWSASCDINTMGDSENNATLDQLRANNGALLKQQLQEAAHACADQLVDDFLGKDRSSD